MTISDPIADMLTRTRNALQAGHKSVSMPTSKMRVAIAEVLKQEGYIEAYAVSEAKPANILRIDLKYFGDRRVSEPVIRKVERVSKPGRRIYVQQGEIPWVLNGMGIVVLSTSQGVMTGQEARRKGIGGELICKVW